MWAFRAAARLPAASAASRPAALTACCASPCGERRRSRLLLFWPHKVRASSHINAGRFMLLLRRLYDVSTSRGSSVAVHKSQAQSQLLQLTSGLPLCSSPNSSASACWRADAGVTGDLALRCCIQRSACLVTDITLLIYPAWQVSWPHGSTCSAVRICTCIYRLHFTVSGWRAARPSTWRSARLVMVTTSACMGRSARSARCTGVCGAAAAAVAPLATAQALLGDSRAGSTALTLLTQRYLWQELQASLCAEGVHRVAQADRSTEGADPRQVHVAPGLPSMHR